MTHKLYFFPPIFINNIFLFKFIGLNTEIRKQNQSINPIPAPTFNKQPTSLPAFMFVLVHYVFITV